MPTTIPTQRVDFCSRGIRCAAWLTLPPGAGPHPAVVLLHGLGATRDMMLRESRRSHSTTETPERRMANRANIFRPADNVTTWLRRWPI
jgi:cephalosporin-C deacetylase-like acetyl esterase